MEQESSLPIPNADTITILTDLIEYEVGLIFLNKAERGEHKQTLNYFWNLFPGRHHKFGRFYLRKQMALLLSEYCGPTENMAHWDRDRWQQMQTDLLQIAEVLLRKDSALRVATEDTKGLEVCADYDEVLAGNNVFTVKMETITKVLEINKAIAPCRKTLEEQVSSAAKKRKEDPVGNKEPVDNQQPATPKKPGKTAEIANVNKATLQEIIDFAGSLKFVGCKDEVKKLFVDGGEVAKRGFKKAPKLHDVQVLGDILGKRPFELGYVQQKVETLIHKLNSVVFGQEDPVLVQLCYGMPATMTAARTPRSARRSTAKSPRGGKKSTGKGKGAGTKPSPKSASKAEREASSLADIENLQKGRDALREGHGDDPLASSIAIAAQAKKRAKAEDEEVDHGNNERRSKRAREEPTKAGGRLSFLDELDCDDEDDERDRVKLSNLPKKRMSTPRRYSGPPPDSGIFDEYGKVRKRRKWTEEEKVAVKLGVKKFGVGKWADIKNEYAEILKNRTSVQIKDVWRTMSKKKEVENVSVEEVATAEKVDSPKKVDSPEKVDTGDEMIVSI